MSIKVNGVTTFSYDAGNVGQSLNETTITPFSDVLKKEQQIEKKSTSSKVAETTSSKQTTSTQSATKIKKNPNGTITTTLDDIFQRASKKYGVSYDFLVAVAKAESDFNSKCVSNAGAKGIMQLMPYEVKELGVDDVFDPEQNIMASAKLLAAHLKKFNGNTTLAAAAYNAGSGAVNKYNGVPPYRETQNYVKKIAKYMSEGAKAPKRRVTVTPNKLSGEIPDTIASSTETTTTTKEVVETKPTNPIADAVQATEEELNQSRVVIGSGDDAVTMTYGAYLKYLELGTLGVG